jgi:hypothetical protein
MNVEKITTWLIGSILLWVFALSMVEAVVGAQHIGPNILYPNPELTPGVIESSDPNVVCHHGYSNKERHVTESEKKAVFAEYHLKMPTREGLYEVDHFIPLCLGGANDIKNLWPEPAFTKPAGFHDKDKVEAFLCREACFGHKYTLQQAQEMIRDDWYRVYIGHLTKHN